MRIERSKRLRGVEAFTTIELIVALTVGLIVVVGAYNVLFSQSRLYSAHSATMDVRQTLRAAMALITWEVAGTAPEAGDIKAIGSGSITFRSLQGSGVICSLGSGRRFGLQEATGFFEATADDSASVYALAMGQWNVVEIKRAFNKKTAWDPAPSGGGTPVCFWGDSTVNMLRPQATLELDGDPAVLDGLRVGAPIRAFRWTTYGLFQQGGRWWLGRRVGSSMINEIVTGPLLPPTQGGLELSYYDRSGALTTDPTQVARVVVVLRAESADPPGPGLQAVRDSLRTTILVRAGEAPNGS